MKNVVLKKVGIAGFSLIAAACLSGGIHSGLAANAEAEEVNKFYAVEGASIRLIEAEEGDETNYSGIRFAFELNKDFFGTLLDENDNGAFAEGVEVSAYLIPSAYLGESVTAGSIKANEKTQKSIIPAEKWKEADSRVYENETAYTSYVHLYNIPQSAYGAEISAFACLTVNGTEYETSVQTRSVNAVAKIAYEKGAYEWAKLKDYLPEQTVTFKDGENSTEQKVKYGATAEAQTPAGKDGYAFNGWLLNGELFDFSAPIKSDAELTAKYMYLPSSEELQDGYTFQIADYPVFSNQQYVSAGSEEYARNMDFADRPEFISDTKNFGEKVLKLTEKGFCAKFDFLKNVLQQGKNYTVTFSLYVVDGGEISFCHTNTDESNRFAHGYSATNTQWNLGATWKWTYGGADDVFMIYSKDACEMYLGNVTVTEDAELYIPTEEKLKEGYTFKMSKALNIAPPSLYASINYIDSTEAMKENGFSKKAAYVTGAGTGKMGLGLTFLQEIFDAGKSYQLSFAIYFKTTSGNPIYYTIGSAIDESSGERKVINKEGNGSPNAFSFGKMDFTFSAEEGFLYPYIGANAAFEMYLGDITVKLIEGN